MAFHENQPQHLHMLKLLKEEHGIKNPLVLQALSVVPRHLFVEPLFIPNAYKAKEVLPLSHNQTISQAYIVALMTEYLIEDGIPDNVLEIGTGSGYQTAILSAIIKTRIVSLERIEALHIKAKKNLEHSELKKFKQVKKCVLKFADGNDGYPILAPYDAILITACASDIPHKLLQQLRMGGHIVMPLQKEGKQHLTKITRADNAAGFDLQELQPVEFVPLLLGLQNI